MKTLEYKYIFLLETRDDADKARLHSQLVLRKLIFPSSILGGGGRVAQPVSEMPMLLSVWPTDWPPPPAQGRPQLQGVNCQNWNQEREWRAESVIMQQKQEDLLGWANKDSEETNRTDGVSLSRERPVLIIAQT